MINVKFFACGFLMAIVFFMIGLLTYGSVIGLVIKNGIFDSVDGYWHSTLINGFVFGLVGFLMVWYAWFDGAPNVNLRRFFSLLIKMILLSVAVYALSIMLIWSYYASFPMYGIFFDSNTMVSIDELNVYWGAVLLLIFWVLSLVRLLVLKKTCYKQHQKKS